MSFIKSLFGKKKEEGSPVSPDEKKLVQDTFTMVVPIAEQAAEIFYNKLFELDPAVRALFKGDMKVQGQKLMTMIGMAAKGLDDLEALVPVVQDLGKRHVGYGVEDSHYGTVGAALLYTLETGLGEAWSEEAKSAWTKIYTLLADTMKTAAAEAA